MKGVEILSSTEVGIDFVFNWSVAYIAFGVILAVGIVIGILKSVAEEDWVYMIGVPLICLVIGLLFGTLLGRATELPINYETQYKVTISDEVSMNEFLDKYEIIDQEGKIYTVRETEQKDKVDK
jgi:hypothetical protein